MTIEHIVFDCDGVLVDSEPLSMRIDVAILAEHGIIMSESEAHARFVGKTFAAMIDDMSREYGVTFPEGLSADKDRRLLELYQRELRAVEGIAAALAAIGRFDHSVASNSPAERVATSLRLAGLTPWFGDRITTFEHVRHGKPEPDVFIEAAHRAGLSASRCLVIEDSVTGVTAASRAGCTVLGFTGTHGEPEAQGRRLLEAGAAIVFPRMPELPGLVTSFLCHV